MIRLCFGAMRRIFCTVQWYKLPLQNTYLSKGIFKDNDFINLLQMQKKLPIFF
jgi:hypothetical protein